jgi:hypothetical protein
MGFTRNTITPNEHKERSLKLLSQANINSRDELNELFFLYNDVLTPRKQDKNCGSCRNYVWNALKRYYGV